MSTKEKQEKLTGKQVRHLRGLGHHMKPLAMLGREGVSDNVVQSVDDILSAHELIKVRVGKGCPLERREAAEIVSQKTGSEVVQVLGKTILLFRANPDRNDDQRIKLPR